MRYKGPHSTWNEIWLKDETRQVTGAFKFRGNVAKLLSLPHDHEVCTASTGNHGYGMAMAAHLLGMRARVYIPRLTPLIKQTGISRTGAQIILIDGDYDQCEEVARHYATTSNAVYVSSFDDYGIIRGHQSLCEEIDLENRDCGVIYVPVGGGGLLSACLLHWKHSKEIIGVESESASAMYQSLHVGSRVTLSEARGIAEGLLVRKVGAIAFDTARLFDPPIALVNDSAIERAIALLWHYNGIRAEGAGAAALAAALATPGYGKRCLCILSGGNIDEQLFQKIVDPMYKLSK